MILNLLSVSCNIENLIIKLREWYQVFINGVLTWDMDGTFFKIKKGYINLNLQIDKIEYTNYRIWEFIMSDRLHEIIAQCAIIHEENLKTGIIKKLKTVETKLEEVDKDVKEHYLMLLMQYYFQINHLKGLKKLLLQGFKFDLRFEDIKEAFMHIKEHEDNVIEFFEDGVVMLKDSINDNQLQEMYNYYNSNASYQHYLEDALELIRKNRYVCAYAYKSKEDYCKFFINDDLLESLKRDLPYLLK